MKEFKIGDVVRLKSGGEQMVIELIEPIQDVSTGETMWLMTCVWHDKYGANCKYDYDERNLIKVSD